MKRIINSNVIEVTMYLSPIVAESSKILSSVSFDQSKHKYHTDVNPEYKTSKPLSDYGEELEPPLADEFNRFKEDCVFLIKELGFCIISQYTSTDSNKSEYIITYGLADDPCGTLVFDIRISDHAIDAVFPEDVKDQAVEYLKMNKVIDGSATKQGIDFCVEQVIIGSVTEDTWDRAFNRLFDRLKRMKNKIRVRNKLTNK